MGEYEIEDDVIGIISPVYYFTMPLLVKRYLVKAKLKAGYVFGILTYGSMSGTAADRLVKILKANGNHIDYIAGLRMADNYLPNFDMENQIAGLPKKNVEARLAAIKQDIAGRMHRIPRKNPLLNIISPLWAAKMESEKGIGNINRTDEKFIVNEKCNACRTCARICPVSNITVEGKPIFQHHCESCFACIHNCPSKAIQMKGQRSEARFRNGSVTLKELIEANGS